MSARSTAPVALFLVALSLSQAEIDYRVVVRPSESGPQRMLVAITVPVRRSTTFLRIPTWAPGAYVSGESFRSVADVNVSGDGKSLTPAKPDDSTWSIPTAGVKQLTFSYTVPVQLSEEIGHFSGPRSYLYVADRTAEPCRLTLDFPAGWKSATGLDLTKSTPGATSIRYEYRAASYDVLADNPVTFGKYRELAYTVYGRPHLIAMYGPAKDDIDTDKLVSSCRFISAAENDFFGGKPPYTHYVWHFNVSKRPDGGGGLEHLASTEITLANGLGPGIIGVNAHEFFHLWNVKRIRSRVLGPFDYTKLPETGALWWLEGVTEYYAHQLMTRYGYWDDRKWYDTLVRNVANVRRVPARLEVGPYESSFRVKDANNGRGNSNGYKISYYDLGVLAGTCLDIEILTRTNGQHSLDDVIHALWGMCKDDQPGFEEGEIRKQCVKFGGPALGDYYDRIVMRAGEIPVEEQLAKVGLSLATFDHQFTDLGIVAIPSFQAGGMTISKSSGPAEGKVKADDVLLEINGDATTSPGAYNAAIGKVKPGDTANLKLKRGEETLTVQVVAGSVNRPTQEVREIPDATPEQKRLRDIWLYRGKKGWKVPD